MSIFLEQLETQVSARWDDIKKGMFWRIMRQDGFDIDLYKMLMIEIYHYTKHNSINQAVASYKVPHSNTSLLRFCFKHAKEELGHENMIVRDLDSIGVFQEKDIEEAPLPATQSLIGYLYYVALNEGALPRLGYSYWAESSYNHLAEMTDRMKNDLKLEDNNMTFFVAHSAIDEQHSIEVNENIEQHVKTKEKKQSVLQVANTTLYMTGVILDNVAQSYLEIKQKKTKIA